MRPLRISVLICGCLLLWPERPANSGSFPARPAPGKGAGATTLVMYSANRMDYSLGNELEAFAMQLRQVDTRVECIPLEQATPEMLRLADYLAVFCPKDPSPLPPELLRAIAEASQPVLWAGYGTESLSELPAFRGQFKLTEPRSGLPAEGVNYRHRSWKVQVAPWLPVQLASNSTAQVLMTVPAQSGAAGGQSLLAWKIGHITFVATVPTIGPVGFLFSDLLWDFYSAAAVPPPRVFVRIEDYHCRRDHRAFRRMVDFLYSRGRPFMVGVIPALRLSAGGPTLRLQSEPEFVATLSYAQQRGGRLLMHGYAHAHGAEPGEGHEFWDVNLDRPFPNETAESVRVQLLDGVRQMLQQGLFPLGWETPHYSASRQVYTEVARIFSTGVERLQLGDATCLENFTAAAPTVDTYGRYLVPENAGYLLNPPAAATRGIKEMGDILAGLRGTVIGCYLHPYQSIERLMELVDTLEAWKAPFLDLADLDHAVQLPEALLLTGRAERRITLQEVTIRRKAFDRAGRLISHEEGHTPISGERTFTGSGAGGYELLEFIKAKP